jgi:hypothetical protein
MAKKGKTFAGAPPGSGKNFAKLKGSLAARGARNPGALAAYIGRKKYGRKGFAKLGHAHSVTGQAGVVEMSRRIPVSTLDEVVLSRSENGAVLRHRRGGDKLGEIRHKDGAWIAVDDQGNELKGAHAHQRGAFTQVVSTWNTGTPMLQRAARIASPPLQPKPEQTPLMEQLGVPAIRLATPANGVSDGPRMTTMGGGSGELGGLSPKGVSIYRKLCARMPKDRAKKFAMRAQSFGGRK